MREDDALCGGEQGVSAVWEGCCAGVAVGAGYGYGVPAVSLHALDCADFGGGGFEDGALFYVESIISY